MAGPDSSRVSAGPGKEVRQPSGTRPLFSDLRAAHLSIMARTPLGPINRTPGQDLGGPSTIGSKDGSCTPETVPCAFPAQLLTPPPTGPLPTPPQTARKHSSAHKPNLLALAEELPEASPANVQEGMQASQHANDDNARPESSMSGKASSAVLADGSNGFGQHADSDSLDNDDSNAGEIGQHEDSDSGNDDNNAGEIVCDSNMDHTTSSDVDGHQGTRSQGSCLDEDAMLGLVVNLSAELRRLSGISGLSDVSASVMVVDESGVNLSSVERPDTEDEGQSLPGPGNHGTGGSGSGDSDMPGEVGSPKIVRRTAEDVNGIPRMWTVTEKGSFAASPPSTGSVSVYSQDDFGEPDHGDGDHDPDWETVAGSRELAKAEPGFDFGFDGANARSGSSLTDDSGQASPSPQTRAYNFPVEAPEVMQHPADERFDHVYRVRETVPEGRPVLLPAYNFQGGMSFPNRNALSKPAAVSQKPYQHPAPLSKGHMHPFETAPPAIMSPKKVVTRPYDGVSKPAGAENGVSSVETVKDQFLGESRLGRGEKGRDDQGQVLATHLGSHRQALGASTSGAATAVAGYGGAQGVHGRDVKKTSLGRPVNAVGTPNRSGVQHTGSAQEVQGVYLKKMSLGRTIPVKGKSPNSAGVPQAGKSRAASGTSTVTWEDQTLYGVNAPGSAHQKAPQGTPHKRAQPKHKPITSKQLRAHRRLLMAEGILPNMPLSDDEEEAVPRGRGSVDITTVSREAGVAESVGVGSASRSMGTASPSTTVYLDAFSRGLSHNPTARLPQQAANPEAPFEYRLEPIYLDETSIIAAQLRRRRLTISRVVLVCLLIFPPLLILYGHGGLDPLMRIISRGQVNRFGDMEKMWALLIGYGFMLVVVCGLIIAIAGVSGLPSH